MPVNLMVEHEGTWALRKPPDPRVFVPSDAIYPDVDAYLAEYREAMEAAWAAIRAAAL